MSWIAEYDTQGREFPTCVRMTKDAGTIKHGVTYVPIDDLMAARDGRKSRWHELFGTPEKAAEYFAMQCFGSDGSLCCYCPFDDCDEKLRNIGAYPSVYDALLEWLRGDAE